jgi:hypothetical protein
LQQVEFSASGLEILLCHRLLDRELGLVLQSSRRLKARDGAANVLGAISPGKQPIGIPQVVLRHRAITREHRLSKYPESALGWTSSTIIPRV